MVIEIALPYAGAAALLANKYRVQLQDVYVSEWSVTLVLDEDLVEHRMFVAECRRQGLVYKEEV